MAEIGFDAIDLNLSDWCNERSPFASDDWMDWIDEIGEAASSAGVRFCQVHAPIFDPLGNHGRDRFLAKLTERTLETCGMLDIPYAVFHRRSYPKRHPHRDSEKVFSHNVKWLRGWAEVCDEHGASMAIENLWEPKASEIIRTIDEIGRDNIHVCLDTGHAYLARIEPAAMVKELGDRLKVLHIHDNDGASDQHVLPYVGRIDWPGFVSSLRAIGFEGIMSLEVHCQVQRMPEDVIDDAVRLALKVGRHLAELLDDDQN